MVVNSCIAKCEILTKVEGVLIMKNYVEKKNKRFYAIGIMTILCCILFSGCSSDDISSVADDAKGIRSDAINESEIDNSETFSANNLKKLVMDVQCKGGMFKSIDKVTVSINGYELGVIEDEEVHEFIMYIDPGEYVFSVKEDGKLKEVRETVRVPDFSDTVFDPAILILYKNDKITWLANDDVNYASVAADTVEGIILPGTEEAVEQVMREYSGEEDDEQDDYDADYEAEEEMDDEQDDYDADYEAEEEIDNELLDFDDEE